MNKHSLYIQVEKIRKSFSKLYIYGCGSYGQNLYQLLKKRGIEIDGFAITNKTGTENCEKPVYNAKELLNEDAAFILALNERNLRDVKKYLKNNNVSENRILNAGELIEQSGTKRGMKRGSIEITTFVGCSVNCHYCPQDKFLKAYYKNDKNRTRQMSLETFERCLDFFPPDYDISFGGMSEPFLNRDCIKMLQLACEREHHISLYTTLVGLRKEDVSSVLELPISFVVLHCADKKGYANIPLTEEYYETFDLFIHAKKDDGSPFVNMCNAQTEADERIVEICKDNYEIFTLMTDRAGNLSGDNLIRQSALKGKIRCGNMSERLDSNVILPDGTVILCCMDYGMKHVLGNIYENSYEEIINGEEINLVKHCMNGDDAKEILCRHCSYARTESVGD